MGLLNRPKYCGSFWNNTQMGTSLHGKGACRYANTVGDRIPTEAVNRHLGTADVRE